MFLRTLQPSFRSFGVATIAAIYRTTQLVVLLVLGGGQLAQAQTNGAATFSQMVPPVASGTVGSDGLLRVSVGGNVIATDDTWPTETIISADLMEGSVVHSSAYWDRQMGNDGESAINLSRKFNFVATLGAGTHSLRVVTYTDVGRIGYSPTYTVNVAGPAAQNGATYDSQSLPAQIVIGASYTANITMKNTGTTTWTSGTYWLGSIGDAVWGTTKVDAGGVPPGGSIMFWVPFTAPSTAGSYNFRWQMFQNGVAFGGASPATTISVIDIPPPTVSLSSTANGRHYTDNLAYVPFVGSAAPGTGTTLKSLDLVEGTTVIKAATSLTSFNETLTLYPTTTAPSSRTFRLRSIDARNQTSLSSAVTIYFDAPTPKVALTKPANGAVIVLPAGATSTTVQVTGTGSAAPGYTLTKLELVVDGTVVSTPLTGSIDKMVTLATGSHTILLRAADNSGSPAVTDSASVSVATTGSAVTFRSLALTSASGTVLAGEKLSSAITGFVKASGLSAGDMVNAVELREGATVLNSMDFPFQMSGDGENPVNVERNFTNMTAGFAIGTHDIYVRAYTYQGSYGDTAHYTVTVTANAAAPTAVFTAPALSYTVAPNATAAVQITGSANDVGGSVTRIDVLDNGGVIDGATGGSINKVVQIGAGTHQLKLRATDNNGAFGYSEEFTITVTVVVPDPTVEFTKPTAPIFYSANPTSTASVSMSGTAMVFGGRTVKSLELFDQNGRIASVTTASISATKAYLPGNYTLTLRITDSGNVVKTVERSFTVVSQIQGNDAVVASQTVPATMRAGQPYNITVVMTNTGTTSWTSAANYQIAAQSPQGDRTWMDTPFLRVPSTIAALASATFTIPITAPTQPGTYSMQWQMQAGSTPFGAATPLLSIPVTAGAGPTGSLSAEPNNVRGASAPVVFTATAAATASTGKLKKLELFRDPMNGTGFVTTGLSTTSTLSTLSWKPSTSVSAGLYLFKLRVTDSADVQTDSDPIIVNVTNSTLLGTLTGVRIDQNKKPQVIGWVCQPSTAQFLNYQLFLDAPNVAMGGIQLAAGLANVSTETDDATVKSSCSTPSTSHHLNVDLSPYTAQYAGRPFYVVAQGYSGGTSVVLPCASNSCTIPGTMRIGMATPLTGDLYVGPASVYMRAVVSGAAAPFDEVSFSVDDVWTAATLEGPGKYSLTKASVANRATPYRIQARVRKGNVTVYSAKSLISVGTTATPVVQLTAPAAGSSQGTSMAMRLSANVSGGVSKIKSVKFYASGQLIATGANSDGAWNTWTGAWTSPKAGTFTILAQVFDGNGVLVAITPGVSITIADTSGTDKPVPFVVDIPALNFTDAGTLPGELAVTPAGDASYSVPLVVPPGTGGMQPELALSYSGSGPNGIVGLGWSLSGLSSIHRCGKTIAQDKVNRGISFDLTDRLCMDGQRLVRVNAPAPADSTAASIDAAYWASNGEYRTEIDTFSRITAVPGPGVAGATATIAFKVEAKEGKVRYYGCDVGASGCTSTNASNSYVVVAASRLFPQDLVNGEADKSKIGQAVSWALSSIVDESKNHIDFDYSLNPNTGEHLPLQVRYGGNYLAPQAAYAAVRFNYDARDDAWTRYVADARNDLRSRITSIKTYIGTGDNASDTTGSQVRGYELKYQLSPTSGRSLLSSLEVCPGGDSSETSANCMAATKFSWGEPKSGAAKAFLNKTPGKGFGGTSQNDCANAGLNAAPCLMTFGTALPSFGMYTGGATHTDYFSFADFDNSGRTSVLEMRIADVSPGISYDQQTVDGEIADRRSNPKYRYGTLQRGYRYFQSTGNRFVQYSYSLSSGDYFVVLSTSDFDGDGYLDLLVLTSSSADAGGTGTGIPKICLSPIKQGMPAVGGNIVFNCTGQYAAVGNNSIRGLPTAVDVVGDGRAAIYGPTTWSGSGVSSATLCIQETCLPNQTNLPSVLANKNIPALFMDSWGLNINYTSFEQMVDFSGTGKPELAQWTVPMRVPTCVGPDCSCNPANADCYSWRNTIPIVSINAFVPPGATAPPRLGYASPDALTGVPYAPYGFDKPMNMGSLAGDFSGGGYSGMVFGLGLSGQLPGSPDIIARQFQFVQCLSTGMHLDCNVRKALSYDAAIAGSKYMKTLAVADFDGDGQVDLLMIETEPKGTAIGDYLQLCHLTSDVGVSCAVWNTPDITPEQLRTAINVTSPGAAGDHLYVMDVEGSGRPQLMYYHAGKYTCDCPTFQWLEDGRWEVLSPNDLAEPKQALDRIYSVKNGVGAVSSVEYADGLASGVVSYVASNLAYPQRLSARTGKIVSKLLTNNGAKPARTVSYQYQNAAADMGGRGSLGFGSVIATNDHDIVTTTQTQYLQAWPYIGTAKSITMVRNGITILTTTNNPEKKTQTTADGSTIQFPYIATSVVQRWDLNGAELGKVTTINKYTDTYGNLNGQIVTTEGRTETFTTDTVNLYQPVTNNSWQIGLKTLERVAKTSKGSSVRRTLGFGYDAAGRLTSETIEPGDPVYQVFTKFDRSAKPGSKSFGLIRSRIQSWTHPVLATLATRTLSDIQYDELGRFPKSIKNALGHEELREYDAATGVLTKQTDPNGLSTIWTFDGFGRVRTEMRPGNSEVRSYLKNCLSDCPKDALLIRITDTFHVGDADAGRIGAPSLIYIDSAGHLLRTQSWGFDGQVTVADRDYDNWGRLESVFQPGFAARGTLAIKYGYDDLDRVTSTTTLDTDDSLLKNSIEFNGYETTLTNPLKQTRVDTRNALGNIVQVRDANMKSTMFEYDAFGNLTTTTDPAQNKVTIAYDTWGRKKKLIDPDLGEIAYDIDPLGRVYWQLNPVLGTPLYCPAGGKCPGVTFDYDLLDRVISRVEPELKSYWLFDTATHTAYSKGKLVEAYVGTPLNKTYSRTHKYDELGRPLLTTQQLTDGLYTSTTGYDTWGRVSRHTHQRGTDAPKTFDRRYNKYGYQYRIERNGLALSEVKVQDAASRPRQVQLANGLLLERDINEKSMRLDGATLATISGSPLITEGYHYDKVGSVKHRTLGWDEGGFDEDFTYDALNRLATSTTNGQTLEFKFDDIGNLVKKTGVGVYEYATGAGVKRPHAVLGFDGVRNFIYDDNGNLTSGAGRSATWTTFDMPKTMGKAGLTSSFVYGPEHQRTWQDRGNGTVVIYADAQEIEKQGTQVTVKTYWPDGIGVEIDRPGAISTELSWMHADNLGSIVGLTDEQGRFREGGKLEYDAWGKRRSVADNVSTADSIDGVVDNRGYTGHEMLDQLDLVHMNGRVYDPLMARFLSADPFIQDSRSGQNFNRYSYVLNSPTNLTDPTGFKYDCSLPTVICRPVTEMSATRLALVAIAAPAARYVARHPQQARSVVMRLGMGAAAETGPLVAKVVGAVVLADLAYEVWKANKKDDEHEAANRAALSNAPKRNSETTSTPEDTNGEVTITPEREEHILDGDGPGKPGGGHRHGTGKPGKSEFPENWSDEKIIDSIRDVANNPNSIRDPLQPNGNLPVRGTRDGVDITVIVNPTNNTVVTGFPTNTPRNPK